MVDSLTSRHAFMISFFLVPTFVRPHIHSPISCVLLVVLELVVVFFSPLPLLYALCLHLSIYVVEVSSLLVSSTPVDINF